MTHGPLVQAYLADLRQALSGLPADEREDVVGSISEHIDQRLAAGPGDSAAVARVLEQLGPVERIAAEAGGGNTPTDPAPEPAARGGSVLVGLAALSLALLIPLPWLAVPVALATLVLALQGARRHPTQRGLYRIAAAVSGLSLLAAVILALTILQTSNNESVPSPPVQITDSPST